ncbi:hypothetical protein SODALDRAFT_309611 [Sodiomyces alkalinus F11]|uniref:peptidylprolyl isomerase n=1 Tax=Sodiomyces alkalinus (strain CBS 110278 / VKM F-3762 / F11) TaxID=1314773 RepID=A0A3N2PZL2_SODAK|nr:hypothetical protein SODALDRAFT_309611 [Sodiomyces alkalinus F11]ROT39954.1 hypothetical protein SODALDRAFT_309611 [Sodiomyces alkalinus F11]
MQGALLSLGLLASAAVGVLAAEDLRIDVTQAVECERKSQSGDRISVHYRGKLQSNGQEFDASYNRGSPFTVKIGTGQVIKGWDMGLMDMCIGEKRTLTIPPELGYGQRAVGPIPAGSTLVFETELMGIDGVPKPEKIVIKNSEATADDKEEVKEEAKEEGAKLGEKMGSVASEAAEAAKTILADTDDSQEHNEL